MRINTKHWLVSVVAAATLGLTSCAPAADDNNATVEEGGTVEVGLITSTSGPLKSYGEAYVAGFEAGLDYATDGTNEVDGITIKVRQGDDAADPDKAVALAKEYIDGGVNILVGTTSSAVALQMAEQAEQNKILYISGPAAADAITGVNDYTFRSGRQTYQDVATSGTFLDDIAGKKVVVFAQDTAFGQGNAVAVEAVLGAKGAEVEKILVAEDVKEFTTFATQVNDAQPDLVFVAWAGETSGAMWQALQQQGVFDNAPVVTGLGDISTYGAYGPVADKISFLSHYFGTAPDNEVNAAMVERVEAAGAEPDLFTPDGFTAALMVVQAIKEGKGDVDKMIAALEGWEFDGPKGKTSVRASDHALIQDMFQATLKNEGGTWVPELVNVVPGDEVAPPEAN